MSIPRVISKDDQKTFRTLKQPATNLQTNKKINAVLSNEANELILLKSDTAGIAVGSAFHLQLTGVNVIVAGRHQTCDTVLKYPVIPFHRTADVFRNASGVVNEFGRQQPERQLTASSIPIIFRGTEQCYVSPSVDVKQGDLLSTTTNQYHVLGVQESPEGLLQILVTKQGSQTNTP